MMSIKRTVERRKNKRYKAIEGAYVAISPNSQKLGQIIDISMGGVCFKYIDTSNDGQNDGTQQEDSIFLSTVGYYSGNLPIKIVGDYAVTNATSFSSMKVKKMHIQFTDFSVKQLFDLDYFLRNFVE
jgi:hypothetical protein